MHSTQQAYRSRTTTYQSRYGFSLVEMVVVIALASLILGVILSLMMGLGEWDRLARTRSTRSEQLLRLADALRSDIRSASDVLVSVEGPLVVMNASGEQWRYVLGPEGCRRTAITPESDERPGDLFAIGAAAKWNVERRTAGRRPLVAVTIEQPADKPGATTRRLLPFLVCAAMGADVWEQPATAE